eukprot:1588740-Pleurochrysis_carterae.AAC.1
MSLRLTVEINLIPGRVDKVAATSCLVKRVEVNGPTSSLASLSPPFHGLRRKEVGTCKSCAAPAPAMVMQGTLCLLFGVGRALRAVLISATCLAIRQCWLGMCLVLGAAKLC